MQNIDFYEGNNTKNTPLQFSTHDPEYFSRMSSAHIKQTQNSQKKASRMIFFIASLCIITFTTGLAVGIKFAGGSKREIIDKQTYDAVSSLKTKLSNIIDHAGTQEKSADKIFPKSQYPYVIKIGNDYSKIKSKEIASYLSSKGHTVILSKNMKKYRIYAGPYKNHKNANSARKTLSSYTEFSLSANIKIIKRS